MTIVRKLFVIILVVAAVASLAARDQTRDTAKVAIGSGSISGTITTDDEQPRPLRRAIVELMAGPLSMPQSVIADDAGRYVFRNLPPGNYTVTARRPGYVRAYYGSRRVIEPPGTPIAVADAPVTNVDLRLMRGGAISGMVRHPNGQPASEVDVVVTRVGIVNGQRQLSLSGIAELTGPIRTDDRGMYRAYGLAPGEYVVMIRPSVMSTLADGSTRRVTPDEVAWADRAIASAGAVAPAGSNAAPPPAEGQSVTFAPVYFPGTTRAAEATVITLAKSEDKTSIDLTIEAVPTSRISGVVYDLDGKPLPQAAVTMTPTSVDQTDITGAFLRRRTERTGADGAFAINGVAPGEYTVTVRASPPGQKPQAAAGQPTAADFAMIAITGSTGGPGSLWASETVNVAGRDVDGVALRLAKGLTITGKIVFESAAGATGDPSRVRMMLMPHRPGASLVDMMSSVMSGMAMGSAIADGTFTVNSVVPGQYVLNVVAPGLVAMPEMPGGTWMLKSLVINGRDVTDLPIDVSAGTDVTGAVMTFTDRLGEISGRVIDQAGRPTASFPIVVFSTNRDTWTINSRRVRRARPATDGKYSIAGLPAGEYFVAAALELSEERLYDPTFLDQLAAGSLKIVLGDGQKLAQDLKLGGGGH